MKRCPGCTKSKLESEFRPHKGKKDGLQPYCTVCDKKRQSDWYQKNKQSCIDKSQVRNAKFRGECREFVLDYLKSNPCVICGEVDPVVLEFDHIGDKTEGMSQLISAGRLSAIKKEIEQCQVLCANCHRRKTAKDFGWYKSD